MATDSIMGLFQTPEQYQLAQQQAQMEQARAYAAQDPMQRAVAGLYFSGGQLGRALGGEDPMLKLATARNQLAQGKDLSTSEGWATYAKELQAAGDLQGAVGASQRATELQAKIDEKQSAREQALTLGRERIQSAQQLAQERNALMLQIAQMNASLRGANSDVQRQLIEQRIQDLQSKADEKQATLQSQAQGRVAAFDSALDTLNTVATHPGKKDVVGAVTGGVRSMIPGTDAAGFKAQLETFKAQTFIPMVANLKGMGALSDAEGKKLTAAVGALDTNMKQSEFDKQVAKIKGDLEAARQRSLQMPGMSKTTAPATSTGAPTKTVKFSDLP